MAPWIVENRIVVTVSFTSNIQRHVDCPSVQVAGTTAREVLENVFAVNPKARSYVLDEHDALRKHMVMFINGNAVVDRVDLTDAVPAGSEVYVMQALSGG
ncbi:MAG: MoaD/ThiS family protein [Planctomycetota bacterium]|jgi:molybdopterin converting factor small subunit